MVTLITVIRIALILSLLCLCVKLPNIYNSTKNWPNLRLPQNKMAYRTHFIAVPTLPALNNKHSLILMVHFQDDIRI